MMLLFIVVSLLRKMDINPDFFIRINPDVLCF